MASHYRAVLTQPGAARLFATALLARMPLGMASLSLLLLVRETTHSYPAAGAALGANAIASALCGPLLGRLIDQLGRRLVLGPAAALQACAYVLLALAGRAHLGAGVLIGGAAIAGMLVPPIASVVRTLMRDLYGDVAVRETAYSMEAVAQEAIWIVGPLLTTVVITLTSPAFAVGLLGGIVICGTLLFLRSPLLALPVSHGSDRASSHGSDRGASRGGARSALASVDLRWLLLPVSLMGAALGAVEVGLPSLALHDGSREASGLLLALCSLGSMLGGVRYSTRRWSSALGSRYSTLLLANCLFITPLLLAHSVAAAAVCSIVAGLAIAPTFSCQYSLVGHVVIPGSEHEAFSWTLSALIGGVAAGSALAGAMISAVGVHGPFMLGAGAAMLAAGAAIRFRGRFAAPLAVA